MSQTAARLIDVELSELEAAVGSTSFTRGRSYAKGHRVVKLDWDPEMSVLLGSVLGNEAVYETAAAFDRDDDGGLEFAEGECSCPVGYNCKHVAALVIAASTRGAGVRARETSSAPPAPSAPAWEQSLRALIDGPADAATGCGLAIELSVREGGPRVTERPATGREADASGGSGWMDQRLAGMERA